MMNLFSIALLAQLAATGQQTPPVLSFPEPGLDDSAAYQGYQTRFFRDAAGNTVQIYLRGGRVVHLWANGDNESLAFTVRDATGRGAPLRWGGAVARVWEAGGERTLEHEIIADAPHIRIGWFVLGSMRVERDFQHAGRHDAAFGQDFSLPEIDRLLAALGRLQPEERQRHLALLGARDLNELRSRLQPRTTTRATASSWVARVVQPSLDGRDSLVLELGVDPRQVAAVRAGDSLSLRARSGSSVAFIVRITTGATALTPLAREEIFTPEFLDFLAAARAAGDPAAGAHDTAVTRARWLERQVRGVELLVSREKLMAGLPNYATYFGRDVLVTALLMRPIWRNEMSEFAIASVLRKLSSSGGVSHEEAMGGQAVREAASEYAALIDEHLAAANSGSRAAADSVLTVARDVLRDLRRVRENYHMIDDEFQLPVLVARYLADPGVTAERKRAFLLDSADSGEPRLSLILRELGLVSSLTAAYARDPVAANLVSFPARDSGWASTSWRDSNAGYAAGRYAMDVNAIWVPHALESLGSIMGILRSLGFSTDSLTRALPNVMNGTPLGGYARDSLALQRAIDAWWSASRHFEVVLGPAEVRARIAARLAAMPAEERAYWTSVVETPGAVPDSLVFLDVALDARGRPVGVANSDPATRLFLGDGVRGPRAAESSGAHNVMRDVRLFVRPYPIGLFIERVGPVVANDAYAQPGVWRSFEADAYHGPRVVWGRDVNLFLMGVAGRIAQGDAARESELRAALLQVLTAVEASGFQSELWSYEIVDGRPVPVRYGASSDVQLWSTTDLAVQFALSRLLR
ncbi:MAG TPA: hypothetical protein VMM77_00630 [Gemmatimonadaceae bacterium]|nr:hypothetical protein [Gemmatimonadaceae bacterium]